jgi:hypothetical protein
VEPVASSSGLAISPGDERDPAGTGVVDFIATGDGTAHLIFGGDQPDQAGRESVVLIVPGDA